MGLTLLAGGGGGYRRQDSLSRLQNVPDLIVKMCVVVEG